MGLIKKTFAGKKININGHWIEIVNALSGGPDCVPDTFLLAGNRSVTWHGDVGWIMEDHGQGEWIPELSKYGVRVRAKCYISKTGPNPIDECLEIIS